MRADVEILIGRYAEARCLGEHQKPTLTETVRVFADYAPAFVPLPHPSPRSCLNQSEMLVISSLSTIVEEHSVVSGNAVRSG